ncbi:hypothetical protein [Mycobacteroides chelonae]|uniref:hypothetical protein n=1 Tax=Mycobacteroides chelonae TaxID=1774 RepID=UPI003AAF56DC
MFEQIQRDCPGVVGLEQTHALAHQAIFLDGQCFAVRFAAVAEVVQAVADHGLDFVTFSRFELY